MTHEEIQNNKEEFIRIYRENIKREGSEELLKWMEKTDFFTAPASSRFHYACEGGLCAHSLSVYKTLIEKHFDEETDDIESFTISALLHDLWKAEFYKVSTRNVKNETTGQWEKVPYFSVEDKFPYGHGEKSVYMISGFMRLTREEAMAIRWHMGFSGIEDKNTIGRALEMYPFAFALSVADMEASYFLEGSEK